MTNINKKALADVVANELSLTKKDALIAVDVIFDEIKNALAENGKVDIAGFGKFTITETKERAGINPSTKEKITIPASRRAKFTAAKALKDAVK